MNDIIRNIEAAQLKAEVPEFRTGDTVRVHALIKDPLIPNCCVLFSLTLLLL